MLGRQMQNTLVSKPSKQANNIGTHGRGEMQIFLSLSRKHTDGNYNFRPPSGFIDPLQGSAASGVDDLDLVLRPKPGVKINHEDYESTA